MINTIIKSVSLGTLILGLSLVGQTTVSANNHNASHDGYNVMIMQHLCNSDIKDINDFKALESGKDPVSALASTVLNCPTTALSGDMAVDGTVASPRVMYDFMVNGEHYGNQLLSEDGIFMPLEISEADINRDVDGNGMISSDTALDVSHYEFANTEAANGRIEVTQTTSPEGFEFGALRFTPSELASNNDEDSLLAIDHVQGRIQLDMTNDTDKTIMLHVYNFQTDTAVIDTGDNGDTGNNGDNGDTTDDEDMDRNMILDRINELQEEVYSLLAEIQVLLGQLYE